MGCGAIDTGLTTYGADVRLRNRPPRLQPVCRERCGTRRTRTARTRGPQCAGSAQRPADPTAHARRSAAHRRGAARAAVGKRPSLARRTLGTIKGTCCGALAYNVAAIPLAVAGLLNPMIAAAAMSFSSVFVGSNSLRQRRFHSIRETTK